MVLGFDMRAFDQVNFARVGDDQLRTISQTTLHARSEHRVGIGGVGANHQQHVCMLDRFEGLRACRRAKGLSKTITGGRMANTRTGVNVVGTKGRANQFLHQIGFFVGATR